MLWMQIGSTQNNSLEATSLLWTREGYLTITDQIKLQKYFFRSGSHLIGEVHVPLDGRGFLVFSNNGVAPPGVEEEEVSDGRVDPLGLLGFSRLFLLEV